MDIFEHGRIGENESSENVTGSGKYNCCVRLQSAVKCPRTYRTPARRSSMLLDSAILSSTLLTPFATCKT